MLGRGVSPQVGLVERNPLLGMLGIMVSLQVEMVEGVSLLGIGREELLQVGLVDMVSPWSGKVLLRVGLAERRPLLEALGKGVPLQVGLVEGELLPIVLGGEMWP